MLRILILADDLSGAADSGLACVAAGLKTTVALDAAVAGGETNALAIDADTRCMDAEAAGRETARQLRLYAANHDLIIFKKIDSTLRGNLAQELAAALETYRAFRGGNAIAIMAPAFPAIGRTTLDGIQLVHGRPPHELDIWRLSGMTGRAFIPEMLKTAGLRSTLLQTELIRSGAQTLAGQMKSLSQCADVAVCDAETDDDLRAIARASMRLDTQPLWVGSAGLAYQLPLAAGLAPEVRAEPLAAPQCREPLLFVIGSLSRNSIEQVRTLVSSGQAAGVYIPPDVLMAGEESSRWQGYANQLNNVIKSGRDVVLSLEPEPQMDLAWRPRLAAALGRLTASASAEVGALIASGGETARAVLRSWGVSRLQLRGELERGIAVSLTEAWSRQLPVITKAGDFGSPGTLLQCAQFLHGGRAHSDSEREKRKVSQ